MSELNTQTAIDSYLFAPFLHKIAYKPEKEFH